MFKIRDLDTHRLIAQRQSAAYKNIKISLPDNSLMIELDWKQKVIIGINNYKKLLKIYLNILAHLNRNEPQAS